MRPVFALPVAMSHDWVVKPLLALASELFSPDEAMAPIRTLHEVSYLHMPYLPGVHVLYIVLLQRTLWSPSFGVLNWTRVMASQVYCFMPIESEVVWCCYHVDSTLAKMLAQC